MVSLFYADPELAIRNAFLYIQEIKENVYVYMTTYGANHNQYEYSLRKRDQILNPKSPNIIFFLELKFSTLFESEKKVNKAAEYYTQKFGFEIKVENTMIKRNNEKIKIWKLVNPSAKKHHEDL